MKQLPKKLFAKIEHDGDNHYFVADANIYTLVEKGEKVQIGTYQLVETQMAEAIVSTSKPIKR
jgi:hypothetical protein